MATIQASNSAYSRGQAARMRGKPFKSNPYKDPKCSTSWSLGWLDWKGSYKGFPGMRRRRAKYLRTVK